MRTTQKSLGGNGTSPWINHDYYQIPFNVTLAGFVSNGANLTWGVQYTLDPLDSDDARAVGISQTTTVITVTDNGVSGVGHGLLAGDDVTLIGTGINGIDGEWAVQTVPTAFTYTLTSGVSQAKVSTNGQAITARVFAHAVLTGQITRLISNYAWPVKASRLVVSNWVAGVATLEVLQGGS